MLEIEMALKRPSIASLFSLIDDAYYSIVEGVGFGLLGILGLVFGAIMIVRAIMLNSKPEQHGARGLLIVIFSVFGVGLILGLMGGIMAMT